MHLFYSFLFRVAEWWCRKKQPLRANLESSEKNDILKHILLTSLTWLQQVPKSILSIWQLPFSIDWKLLFMISFFKKWESLYDDLWLFKIL